MEEPGRLQCMGWLRVGHDLVTEQHKQQSNHIDTEPNRYIFLLYLNMLCTGEGNGIPLQYSCLENPMDGGAWQAAVHGVTRVGHD